MVGGLELAQDKLSFTSLLLVGCEGLGVFQFGNGDDVKSHIVLETSGIVVDETYEMWVNGLTDQKEREFHGVHGVNGEDGEDGENGRYGEKSAGDVLDAFHALELLDEELELVEVVDLNGEVA